MQYISVTQYLMGRATIETLSPELVANLNTLIPRVNELLEIFLKANSKFVVTVHSGFRRQEDNDAIPNAAKKSKHMLAAAIDIGDTDDVLDAWCMANQAILKRIGLYLEHPSATKGWTHLQCIPPKSGNTVFYP